MYRASARLESFLLSHAPAHVAVEHGAPSSLEELQRATANGGPLPVWSGGSDATIYSSPRVNHAFRAWHDAIHLELGAAFDAAGEAMVDALALERARDAGMTLDDLLALHFDTWGQVAYAELHAGAFPANQAAFVAACFVNFDAAIRANY